MPIMDYHKDNTRALGYKLFIPKAYDDQQAYPLILFLHGIKRRGTDLGMLENYGLIKYAEEQAAFPFMVVAPQCPATVSWTELKQELIDVLSTVQSNYKITQNYVMGFSMGGNGTWDLAATAGHLFNAAVPIAGWYAKEEAHKIDIPVWTFHCEDDDIVPVAHSIEMVEALKAASKDIQFTMYSGLQHNHSVMENTFSNKRLIEWLLSK